MTFLLTDIEGSSRLWEAHSESTGQVGGPVHAAGMNWRVLGARARPITAEQPSIHQSVRDRMGADSSYRVATDLNRVAWDDIDWTRPRGRVTALAKVEPAEPDEAPLEEVAP